jgi:4,5-DOPA dioxygenase extradiol
MTQETAMSRLPTLFISHGSPMLALEPGTTGPVLTRIGQQLPKPKAVLVISAHWLTQQPTLTSSAAPETIHDFGGFPRALYALQYPAPGSPALAAQVQTLLKKIGLDARLDAQRGLDHGAWVPLRYLYPDADVPVVQLSLNPSVSPKLQFALGQFLRDLSAEGVLILASGSFTHNLGELHWDSPQELPEAGDPYVDQFQSTAA